MNFKYVGQNTINVDDYVRYLGITRRTEAYPCEISEKIVKFKAGDTYEVKETKAPAHYTCKLYDEKKRLLWEELGKPVLLWGGDTYKLTLGGLRFE